MSGQNSQLLTPSCVAFSTHRVCSIAVRRLAPVMRIQHMDSYVPVVGCGPGWGGDTSNEPTVVPPLRRFRAQSPPRTTQVTTRVWCATLLWRLWSLSGPLTTVLTNPVPNQAAAGVRMAGATSSGLARRSMTRSTVGQVGVRQNSCLAGHDATRVVSWTTWPETVRSEIARTIRIAILYSSALRALLRTCSLGWPSPPLPSRGEGAISGRTSPRIP